MSLQMACLIGCKITLVAFVWFLSSVCYQMCPQITYPRGNKITLFAFVWFFSTVRHQMFLQIVCPRGNIVTLVAFVWLFSNMCFIMSPQMTCLNRRIFTLVAFVWLFSASCLEFFPSAYFWLTVGRSMASSEGHAAETDYNMCFVNYGVQFGIYLDWFPSHR